MKTTYETGLQGEKQAADWLQKHYSMKLLESRYRNKAGEIDLIMLDREIIVFVEVKTRMHALSGTGLLSVDRNKQKRITNAAVLYLINRRWQNKAVRFDIVEVSPDNILYVPNAFQPGGMFYR